MNIKHPVISNEYLCIFLLRIVNGRPLPDLLRRRDEGSDQGALRNHPHHLRVPLQEPELLSRLLPDGCHPLPLQPPPLSLYAGDSQCRN